MKFTKQIAVDASAEKVWDVLGRDFANIGVWSTAVSHSAANNEIASVNNSPVGGRLCETSLGKISEEFTAYDDQKKTFSFKGVFGSKMFKSVTNSAALTSISENETVVKITPEIKLSFIGTLMSPMIRIQLNKLTDQILNDLKYYVEKGKPSPEKLASQKK
ncbi:MAG: SRPBCC family protein [Saprospiraceae bacterium]|nr:SRPBCC family protein [Saprospiraceae bacterium]